MTTEIGSVVGRHCGSFVFIDVDDPRKFDAKYWAVCDTCHKIYKEADTPSGAKHYFEINAQ